MKLNSFLAALLMAFSFSTYASDVLITTDISKGQGFFYQVDNKCYLVTPSHVSSGAKTINFLTSSREVYDAAVLHEFDVDLAILSTSAPPKECDGALFSQIKKLSTLLKVYEEAVLKTKLADGSTIQTKVDIVGVDDTEFLEIRPQSGEDGLKQGYSGSVLFVANQPSGILLEVYETNGFIYRSDALKRKLDSFFVATSEKESADLKKEYSLSLDDVDQFNGELSKGQVVKIPVELSTNSPVEFIFSKTEQRVDFEFEILDERDKRVFRDKIASNRDQRFAFTSKGSGVYTIQLTGKKLHGLYDFRMEQWALDSELAGAGNVLDVGDAALGRLAEDAVARYKMPMKANSPVEFIFSKTEQRVDFEFEILDERDKRVFRDKIASNQDQRFAFTPKVSGAYTVQLTGKKFHGNYEMRLEAL